MRALLLLAVLMTVGCQTTPSTYWRSRAGDALDVVPVSVATGTGFGVSLRATSVFHVGLAGWPVSSKRRGYDDRVVRGTWREYSSAFPWTLFVEDDAGLPPLPLGVQESVWERGLPIVYRWQTMRDAPQGEGVFSKGRIPDVLHVGRHPSYARESMGAFGVPEVRRRIAFEEHRLSEDDGAMRLPGTPDAATGWDARRGGVRMPADWDRFEADIFVGLVGLRVGLRPWQLVDFLAGWFQLDPAGDDLPDAETFGATSASATPVDA